MINPQLTLPAHTHSHHSPQSKSPTHLPLHIMSLWDTFPAKIRNRIIELYLEDYGVVEWADRFDLYDDYQHIGKLSQISYSFGRQDAMRPLLRARQTIAQECRPIQDMLKPRNPVQYFLPLWHLCELGRRKAEPMIYDRHLVYVRVCLRMMMGFAVSSGMPCQAASRC